MSFDGAQLFLDRIEREGLPTSCREGVLVVDGVDAGCRLLALAAGREPASDAGFYLAHLWLFHGLRLRKALRLKTGAVILPGRLSKEEP